MARMMDIESEIKAAMATAIPTQKFADSGALLTVQDVAEILKVPVSWVYDHVRPRAPSRLPHLKLGKYLRFRAQDVQEFLERVERD